jgi:tetratricopeptide (TPR) repeat protein
MMANSVNFGRISIMAEKQKKSSGGKKPKPKQSSSVNFKSGNPWMYLLPVLAVAFILFFPALQNGFTNWDDVLYVTQNALLEDLSIEGWKKIFSTPIVSNYHPLTILSLALNYQFAELSPLSYHLTSILLHLINTALVFWFIRQLSSENNLVSAFVALLFAIHPMHVESVAWISERKDLLYTLFYVAAMIVYVSYVRTKQIKYLVWVTVLGALSLLCKPSAIVLPLSLLTLDYFLKREWKLSWITEKIPLFILSAVMAYVTLTIQSQKAVASVEVHDIVDRICYAGFGLIWYLLKVIVPYPLSALHPFPKELSVYYYLGTAASVAGILYLALKVRSRNYLFGFGFYIINLLLVLQLVSIGNAVVAERYTYVPYISIFFLMAMEVARWLGGNGSKYKWIVLSVAGIWICALGYMTWNRIPVWKTSQSLWADVLSHYPNSSRAWTNKGLDFYDQKKWPEVIEHLTKALEEDPKHKDALEWRGRTYLELKEPEKALADATLLHKLYPNKEVALFLLARAQDASGLFEQSIANYNQLVSSYPDKPEYINNRGVVYFNKLKNFQAARADFEEAIRINPNAGSYYLNLSRCYYMMSDISGARKFALQAKELGAEIDESYGKAIGIN